MASSTGTSGKQLTKHQHQPSQVEVGFNGVPTGIETQPKTKNFLENLGFGCFPPGYDRRVHGPYYPSRYYPYVEAGQAPPPKLGDVKLSQLTEWVKSHPDGGFNPRGWVHWVSRAQHRWVDKFVTPRYSRSNPVWQFFFLASLVFYIDGYFPYHRHHKVFKYHW